MDTIAAEDLKFAIYEATETTMKIRVLHLEPGKIGFNSFTPAEYMEEKLGRFMNARTKGGAQEEFEHKKQRVNEDTLEYYDTKLHLYLHSYVEGERNKQEFKRLTFNGLRNIGMLKNCWNELSKRTSDWGEERNWNLHPSNPNPDITGLKDANRSGEDIHLGNTGQVRMKVNTVTAPVGNARSSMHVKRDYPEKTQTEDQRENLAGITVTRRDTWLRIAGDRRGIEDVMLP